MFLLDVNVVIDAVSGRPPRGEDSARLLASLLERRLAAVSSASLPIIQYVVGRRYPDRLEALQRLFRQCPIVKTPAYVDFDDDLARHDLEDYLVALSARAIGAKVLTADAAFLDRCPDAVHPDELLSEPAKTAPLIPFCDLRRLHERLAPRIEHRLDTVFRHAGFVNGPEVKELEERCAEWVGVDHAIGTASGTDALLVILMALGVGPGDYVLTTPFTFIATAEVIAFLGATPLFADIDPETYNLDPGAVEQVLADPRDPRTGAPIPLERLKGIIAVDLFGQIADYDALSAVINKHNPGMFLIEDAAQSFGAECAGRPAGAFGHAAAASFFPAKPLGCAGDGGMVFTNDAALAAEIRKIVNHGQSKRYHHARLGLNARLDTLQAALLLAKLDDYLGPEKTHSTGSSPAPEAASQASSSPVPEAAKPTGPLPGQETTEHAAITPNPSAPGHTAPPIPPAPDNDTLPPGPAQRNQVAAAYTEALSPLAAQGLLHLPTPIPNPKWWRRLQPARHDQAKSSSCAPTPDTPPRQGRNVGSSESLVLSVPPRQGWDPCCESSGSQRDETLPDSPASLSAWSQYSIQFLTGPAPATRDAAADFLKNHGIPTAVHYPVPLHQQPVFESLGYQQGAFPVAESVSQRILSLPFDALKTKEEIHQVTQSLTAFFHTNISED